MHIVQHSSDWARTTWKNALVIDPISNNANLFVHRWIIVAHLICNCKQKSWIHCKPFCIKPIYLLLLFFCFGCDLFPSIERLKKKNGKIKQRPEKEGESERFQWQNEDMIGNLTTNNRCTDTSSQEIYMQTKMKLSIVFCRKIEDTFTAYACDPSYVPPFSLSSYYIMKFWCINIRIFLFRNGSALKTHIRISHQLSSQAQTLSHNTRTNAVLT